MQLAEVLMRTPSIQHGTVKILFTPDEEVGRGVEHVDLQKLGADFAYTLDGGERGSLEIETFNADGVEISIDGVIAHPGYAKGKLVNAIKILSEFIASLPKDEWSPETTESKQGFVHPTDIRGTAEKASAKFIIRDFENAKLTEHEHRLETLLKNALRSYPQARYEFVVKEQYRNMKTIIDQHPRVSEFARQAMKACGIDPIELPIRGGTDGSRLSQMGLPCPNIFTGEMALHSKHEYVSVQDMEASLNVLIELLKIWESTPVE
jgi:tripeptide aminopeptidase